MLKLIPHGQWQNDELKELYISENKLTLMSSGVIIENHSKLRHECTSIINFLLKVKILSVTKSDSINSRSLRFTDLNVWQTYDDISFI